MNRMVVFSPAYDHSIAPCDDERCRESGGRWHGQHAVECHFYVEGDLGVVEFSFNTGFELRTVTDGPWGRRVDPSLKTVAGRECFPTAKNLGHHWRTPVYDGELFVAECELVEGGCYADGSGLNAEPLLAALIEGGSDAVWPLLEGYYADLAAAGAVSS